VQYLGAVCCLLIRLFSRCIVSPYRFAFCPYFVFNIINLFATLCGPVKPFQALRPLSKVLVWLPLNQISALPLYTDADSLLSWSPSISMRPPYRGHIKRCTPSVRLSVCLSRALTISRNQKAVETSHLPKSRLANMPFHDPCASSSQDHLH